MELVKYPDDRLRCVCKEAIEVSPKERATLAASMWKIMNENNGIGLSAPQVGLDIRMFVWRHYRFDRAIWNPVMCEVSGLNSSIEGCISLPGIRVTKERSNTCYLIGTDIDGKQMSLWGNDINTRIWQHEISHLNGELIIDQMGTADHLLNQTAISELLKNRHCNK
jgi:peptide deformylase